MQEFDAAVAAIPPASVIQGATFPKTAQAARVIELVNKALLDAKQAIEDGAPKSVTWVIVDIKPYALSNDALRSLSKVYAKAGYKLEHWMDRDPNGKETLSVNWG